jgi:hypothetical protein
MEKQLLPTVDGIIPEECCGALHSAPAYKVCLLYSIPPPTQVGKALLAGSSVTPMFDQPPHLTPPSSDSCPPPPNTVLFTIFLQHLCRSARPFWLAAV